MNPGVFDSPRLYKPVALEVSYATPFCNEKCREFGLFRFVAQTTVSATLPVSPLGFCGIAARRSIRTASLNPAFCSIAPETPVTRCSKFNGNSWTHVIFREIDKVYRGKPVGNFRNHRMELRMYSKLLSSGALLTYILLLAGCASTPQQTLDPTADLRSKKIAIVPVGIPKVAEVSIVYSSGAAFGLIGGLVDAARFLAHAKDLASILEKQQFNFHIELSDGVAKVGQDNGMHVIVLDETRIGSDRAKWMTSTPNGQGADYYLDVVFKRFGYIAQTDAAAYVPSIDVCARMTDASGKPIFSTEILYNPALDFLGNFKGPKIKPDPQYQFASMDALKADPQKTAEGLRTAISAVLQELNNELKKPTADSTVALAK